MRIAICDDTEFYRENIRTSLLKLDCIGEIIISEYEDGYDLIESYEAGMYDLIILDYYMKTYNGYETAIKIREIDMQVCIIMAINEDIGDIKSFGAISKIGKPVNQTELCNANCKCKEELSTSKGYIEFFVDGKKRKILIDEILYIDSCNSIRTRNFKVITDNKINLDIERFDKYQKNN